MPIKCYLTYEGISKMCTCSIYIIGLNKILDDGVNILLFLVFVENSKLYI